MVSPDKKTLLVLTSGYNRVYRTDGKPDAFGTYFNWPDSQEYVFIYDISTNTPVKKQVVKVPNTYNGIAFDPSGTAFYVSSGMGDFPFDSTGTVNPAKSAGDNVHIFTLNAASGAWQHAAELALGHTAGLGLDVEPPTGEQLPVNERVAVSPCAAGVAVSQDGKTLVVANYYNDSITVFTGGLGNWSKGTELDLRPGKSDPSKVGRAGRRISVLGGGEGQRIERHRVRLQHPRPRDRGGEPGREAGGNGPHPGERPTEQDDAERGPDRSCMSSKTSRIRSTSSTPQTNAILETIPVLAHASVLPASLAQYKGANPNSVTLSPDEKQLYVTLGNLNAVAVVALGGTNSGDQVVGLIPTGWYPNSVSFSGDGKWVYVVNGKSPTGPNPDFYYSYGPPTHKNGYASNQYNPQLIKAGLQSFPLPDAAQLSDPDGAGGHEQPLLPHRERQRRRGHGGCAAGRQARDLHHQGKPDLRPDPGRPGDRQRRSGSG